METFVRSLKRKYRERLILSPENQYPPSRGEKLVKLELVEGEKTLGYAANWQRGKDKESIDRHPIECTELFETDKTQPLRRVLVEGDAGIGKTTLTTILTMNWAGGKLLCQFCLVLLLPLRDKRVAKAASLSDLLNLFHTSTKICSSVVEFLEEMEGEDVLIIADGWDELSDANREPGSFLHSLLFGNVLPFVSVLVTSRPSVSSCFHKSRLVNRFVEVVGFSQKNIIEYIQSEFQENPEKAVNLLQQLESNPLVASICSVPLNCSIICHLQRTPNQSLPHTMTELYTKVILQTLYRNITKCPQYLDILSFPSFESLPEELQASWYHLCEFAYQSILKDQLVFSEEELLSILPDGSSSIKISDVFSFGLLQSTHSILSTEAGYGLSFHFVHLTFQEYLAALHLVRQSPETQLAVCHWAGNSSRFRTMWMFFFGLACNLTTTACVNQSNLTERFLERFISLNWTFMNYRTLRLLSHCCFESNNSGITKFVAHSLSNQLSLEIRTAHDCSSLVYVLSALKSDTCVHISFNSCRLQTKIIIAFLTALSTKCKQLVRIKSLMLKRNDLTDLVISKLFSIEYLCRYITRLDLSDNQIGQRGVHCIMEALSLNHDSPSSLSTLNLSRNHLGAFGLQALEGALLDGILPSLEQLDLANTLTNDPDINGAVLVSFLQALSANCLRLRMLDLSGNYLSLPGGQAIGKNLIQPVESLSGEYFTLCLDETVFGDEGIIALVKNLCHSGQYHNLTLRLFGNELHHHGVQILSESVMSGLLRVTNLTLDGNPLGLLGTLAICRMLSCRECCIEYLSLANCCLALSESESDNFISHSQLPSEHDVANIIQQLPLNKSIEILDISQNDFSGDKCFLLSAFITLCCHTTPEVELFSNQCSITSSDIQLLLSLCRLSDHPPSSLCFWYLQDNKFDNKGIELLTVSIPTLIPSIEGIFLGTIPGADPETMKKLKDAVLNQKKVKVKRQKLRERVLSGLCQDDRHEIEEFISCINYNETQLRSAMLMKMLLMIIFIETLYTLSPHYPLHPPTIILDVANRTDTQNLPFLTQPLLTHVFCPGLRVVRGRDWDPVDTSDGGEGHVGTVVEISEPSSGGGRTALVQWDCVDTGHYRCGVEGKFDLRVLDSAPTKISFSYVGCDSCDQFPISGMRWKCTKCWDYDLCSHCYHQGAEVLKDSLKHEFVRHDRPSMSSELSVQVSPRVGARRLEAKGIFPGAVVVRGPDWNHGDDDGGDGGTGIVIASEKTNADKQFSHTNFETQTTSAKTTQVLWNITKRKTTLRLGYLGKVEVKCITPSSGSYYYPDHLPMLGAPYSIQQEQADKVKHEQLIQQHDQSDVNGDDEKNHNGESRQDQVRSEEKREETDHGGLCVDDLKTVRTALWEVRSEWYNVGIELNMSTSSLDAIKRTHHHVVEDCFTAMLQEWLERSHPPPTWAELVEALRSPPVNNPQLGEELEIKYC